VLSAVELTLGYDDGPVLQSVDLTVDRGEVVAVVGPSGTGKSSLLLALCGLLVPERGVVTVDGTALSSAPARVRDELRRRHFGFVFQFGDLVPELTMLENVCLPLRLLGMRPRRALPVGSAQMEALGIAHLADKPVTGVSGGEMQRAAICRALVHGPSVVLADEPTGALDDDNAALVFDLLVRHARGRGAGVVLVTHEVALARRADRVLRIRDGRLHPER
jgi:putative ABC transport system ATP-binding protein